MIKKLNFKIFALTLVITLFSGITAFAAISNLTDSLEHQQPVYNVQAKDSTKAAPAPFNAFCDPVEISIAIAQNAFEKDYFLNSDDVVKVKKPLRWTIVKEYTALPFDAVPYEVIYRGTRSEGYFSLNGNYNYGAPDSNEASSFLLEYENYVEIVFSVYSADGKLIEDIAGVYQVNADTQELVTDTPTLLKRMLELHRSDATLPVYEKLCFQMADTSVRNASRTNDFSVFFEYADFIEKRCEAVGHTPLYTAEDLYSYYNFINHLDQGLNLFLFQLRSTELKNHALIRQCRNAITRLDEVRDLLADTVGQ